MITLKRYFVKFFFFGGGGWIGSSLILQGRGRDIMLHIMLSNVF